MMTWADKTSAELSALLRASRERSGCVTDVAYAAKIGMSAARFSNLARAWLVGAADCFPFRWQMADMQALAISRGEHVAVFFHQAEAARALELLCPACGRHAEERVDVDGVLICPPCAKDAA